jgi:hypothetical protein
MGWAPFWVIFFTNSSGHTGLEACENESKKTWKLRLGFFPKIKPLNFKTKSPFGLVLAGETRKTIKIYVVVLQALACQSVVTALDDCLATFFWQINFSDRDLDSLELHFRPKTTSTANSKIIFEHKLRQLLRIRFRALNFLHFFCKFWLQLPKDASEGLGTNNWF